MWWRRERREGVVERSLSGEADAATIVVGQRLELLLGGQMRGLCAVHAAAG
jgi:hypothetical protein